MKQKYYNLELFAGCGGLALGLERAGFKNIGLIENNKHACNTLKTNRPNWNVINEDIRIVIDKGIKHYLSIENIELDLLSGGFPCQAFSYAGKKLGFEDVRGTMFYYYAAILKELQPKMFLVENVKGLLTHDKGNTLNTIISIFNDIGYITQYKVLNTYDYGVAQKRERLIIIGIRKDLDILYEFPKKYTYNLVLKDVLKDVPKSKGYTYSEKKKKF